MNSIEKKQKKWLDKNSNEPLVITGERTCYTAGEYIKGEIYMSLRLHKKQILSLIEELEGKVKKLRVERHSVSIGGRMENCCKCNKAVFIDEVLEIIKVLK